ncbi:hypothetical protein OC845_005251 [Tilletia horrida]|nr:hypothetical protein OC845_005251 [Tilletia horrida]
MAADASTRAAAAALLASASASASASSSSSSSPPPPRRERAAPKTTASHRFSPLSSASPSSAAAAAAIARSLITNTNINSTSITSRKGKEKVAEAPPTTSTADTNAALYAAAQALTAAVQHMESTRISTGNGISSSSNGGGKVPRKRNRAVLSCLKCHQRRVKCDRKQPCGACIRHGTPHECRVPDNAKAQQERVRINQASSSATSDAPAVHSGRNSIHANQDAHMDSSGRRTQGDSGDEDELMDEDTDDPRPYDHSLPGPAARSTSISHGHPAQSNTSHPSVPAGPAQRPPTTQRLHAAASLISPHSALRAPVSDARTSPTHHPRFYPTDNRANLRPAISNLRALHTAEPTSTSASPGNRSSYKPSYLSHRSADVLTRFINQYEDKVASNARGADPGRAPRAPRWYSQAHIDEIGSFCENLPLRSLDILINSYLNEIDWMYQIVDPDTVIYNLLPDLSARVLDSHLTWFARPQEWTNALRWGDMTRLSLLGGMILGSVQATAETVLKLTFKQTAAGSPPGGRISSLTPSYQNNNDDVSISSFVRNGGAPPPGLTVAAVAASARGPGTRGDVMLSSAQSTRSGSSGIQDPPISLGGPPVSHRPANSVKTEVLSVLESQVRHLIHLASAVEGPTPDLVKARLIMLNYYKNEARLAEPECTEFLHDTVEITMRAALHEDPEPLNIGEDEKEDRRRLFYNIYAFDRFSALFFGRHPFIPEEEMTTELPRERWLINGKEHLYSFLVFKGRLAKIVTHIASAALEVPVDGEKVSNLEVELQDFSRMTQGTPFHPSLPQIPPELSRFHTLDRQRHLYLICFHSVREALHRLVFFPGPMISAQHARYSREACAESAVALLETQRSLRLRICSPGDLCCYYIPFFNLEPAITLVISAILLLEAEPAQSEADYIRSLPIKKARVDYYMQWAQLALDLLSSMPEDIAVATQGSYLLRRVLRKAAIIVEHSTGHLLPVSLALGAATTKASLERTSAWMQDLFCDEHGQRMKMPYLTAPPRPPPFTRAAPRPETFAELQRASDPSTSSTGARSLDVTELSNIGTGASTGVETDTLSANSAPNFTRSLLESENTGTTAASFPVSELVPYNGNSTAAISTPSATGARPPPYPTSAHLQPEGFNPVPAHVPSSPGGFREMSLRSHATSLPPDYVFDFSNVGGSGGVSGSVAAGGRSLADMGLGFLDALFDSRNTYAPFGANASMSSDNHLLNSLPSSSSGPSTSTAHAGLVAPSGGASAGIVSSSSGGEGFGHEYNNMSNSGGSGSLIPGVGPGPEASLASMGLEDYMNAWLLSIQNNSGADRRARNGELRPQET